MVDKHLDDCPCDWETNDWGDDLAIIFNTAEE